MKFLKGIKYIILSCTLMLSSCFNDNFIDVAPTDVLSTDISLQTIEDFEAATLGAYSSLTSAEYIGTTYMTLMDILSDNAKISGQNRGQGVAVHNYTFTDSNGEATIIWSRIYQTIDRVNIILTEIDAKFPTADARVNQIKGQCLALRAMCHFDLVRLYAPTYNAGTAASDLGVPVMTKSEITEPSRNTVAEVYTQVIADLQQAETLMTIDNGVSQMSSLGATALLSRVYLYQQDWTNAIAASSKVINAKALATRAQFANVWMNDAAGDANGVIFRVSMGAQNANIGNSLWEQGNDNSFFNPTADLLALYDAANDIRYATYYTIRPGNVGGDLVAKYPNTAADDGTPADINLFRVAEQYLIRAEAYAKSGNDANALADLNALRTERITGVTPLTATGAALLTEIDNERRRELAWEGHRFLDIKRAGGAIVRGADCSATQCTLPAGDIRFVFPIPSNETFANPNMVQNPGY